MRPLQIAVIGSGISGLSAAWLLSQSHDVTIYEASSRLGGHSNTVDVTLTSGQRVPVDTGFIVSNTWTYPNFTALMDYLDVEMTDTRMTFSVSLKGSQLEYSGHSLATMMGTARQWLAPSHWRMIADLVRFYQTAEARAPFAPHDMTLGQYLKHYNYSSAFVNHHILPIAGAIWSTRTDAIADYPFRAFVDFFANHKLFMLGDRPLWQTVRGGSREYVRKLVEDSKFTVRMDSEVAQVMRGPSGVVVTTADGSTSSYDHVVIATHGDQALGLLADPSHEEDALLSTFATCENRVLLHRDQRLMPKGRRFWSAWNYDGSAEAGQISVTYWMNALQKLDSPEQHFVSLNPAREPAPETVDRELVYRHPVFTPETRRAQQNLWNIQGRNRTWFAGAWFGAGFHEDGLQAGLAVAEQLGGLSRPWSVKDPSSRIVIKPVAPPATVAITEVAE